ILALGASSGFPNQITESALQAWLKDAGATNTTIGIMSYVAIPYLLKFLFALQDPQQSLLPVTVCAAAIVFFSATQDIAIDAWRTDVSLPEERGPAAAANNLGYRFAAYVALAVALILADHVGWRPAFLVLAAAMLLFCAGTLFAPASHNSYQPRSLA